jgi:chromosome segregation ATPase
MQTQIENLVKLQNVDLERTRLTLAARALPAEVAQAEAALAAAERQSAEASSALSREESLRTRLDREIATHRQKAARFRTQLDTVKTPEQAAAIEHEIAFASSEADRLENEDFASLERTEAQEAALAALAPRSSPSPEPWTKPAPVPHSATRSSSQSLPPSTLSAMRFVRSSTPSRSFAMTASPARAAQALRA